ncbi:MAG: cytochrome C [Gemmatimonadales bacterium]|nr:MAG: cytochrome C [Gemmatimonadales bacterium]
MGGFLRFAAMFLLLLVVLGLGFYGWASASSSRSLARTFDSHAVDFPVPYPLAAEEVEALSLSEAEADQLALARALERGEHLIRARYGCTHCHGHDFGGGVMVDAFPLGTLLGPNLTSGEGGVVATYSAADWDRAVRHGILPDGRPAVMPSEDFLLMSDQELSDIIVYIRSMPPVDNSVRPSRLGPLGKVLMATGQLQLSADLIGIHDSDHLFVPPPATVSVAFGRHLGGVCTGCHSMTLAGGPVAGGDPSWPPASNLTPHADGLAGWNYADFRTAMLESRRPDGTEIGTPMTFMTPSVQAMTATELEALWVFLQSLEPRPTPR